MSGSVFTVGDVVHLDFEVVTGEGAPVDPSAVVLTVKLPDLTVVTIDPLMIVRVSAGAFTCDYPTVQAGTHAARWVTTEPSTTKVTEFDTALDQTSATPYAPVYAVAAQYEQITGSPPPVDIVRKLAKASRLVDRLAMTCLYERNADDTPKDPVLASSFAEAVVRQVEWEEETADTLGLLGAFPNASIGGVSISRGRGGGAERGNTAWARAAPLTLDALQNAVDSRGLPMFTGFPIVLG